MTIEERNKLERGEAYSQAETALCIWEYVIDSTHGREDREAGADSLINWFTQDEGIYAGRHNAIKLAHLVDYAWTMANGEEHLIDGYAFDWEIVPYVIDRWSDMYDAPHHITIESAELMAEQLRIKFHEEVTKQ